MEIEMDIDLDIDMYMNCFGDISVHKLGKN